MGDHALPFSLRLPWRPVSCPEVAALRARLVGVLGGGTDDAGYHRARRDPDGLRARIGIAEVTLEANPDTVTRDGLAQLADAGFTRVSSGHAVRQPRFSRPDRTHDTRAKSPVQCAGQSEAGLSVLGGPHLRDARESLADWDPLRAVLIALRPIKSVHTPVEEGTKMGGAGWARENCRPPTPTTKPPSDELAGTLLGEAGYAWYEISNFARATGGADHAGAAVDPL